jgi:hypothetical protein
MQCCRQALNDLIRRITHTRKAAAPQIASVSLSLEQLTCLGDLIRRSCLASLWLYALMHRRTYKQLERLADHRLGQKRISKDAVAQMLQIPQTCFRTVDLPGEHAARAA